MKKLCVLLTFLLILIIVSCEIGLGSAVDVSVPNCSITYPPKNAVARDSFVVAGTCEDDMGISEVKVSIIDTQNNKTYGPYQAEIGKEIGKNTKSWTVTLNQKDPSKTSSVFDSYKQWEYPDGNYIINAVAYDYSDRKSAVASSPISIDNTAPVLIVSKPLATGPEAATIYGNSLKLSGDLAEDHETSRMVLYYREYDEKTGEFKADSSVKSIEITDSNELNAMSSSNPLLIAKLKNGEEKYRKNYISLYGDSENGPDKYYYCGFLIEDNAKLFQNPGDNGSGTGNQSERYYLLGKDFQNKLAVDYSLTALKLKQILKGQSEDYSEKEINAITTILSKAADSNNSGNYALSAEISKEESTKFSLNPHNNPSWVLEDYALGVNDDNSPRIEAYAAGSSLILTLTAGRDASYPDPKSVTLDIVDVTPEFDKNEAPVDEPVIHLIGPQGKIIKQWNESADDSSKSYTFTLDVEAYGLSANHIYEAKVSGTDRNGTEAEPENGNRYIFLLSTSNNAPRITISEPSDDITYGTEVNSNGITIKGFVVTDNLPLKKKVEQGGVIISKVVVSDLKDGTPVSTISAEDFTLTYNQVEPSDKRYRYPFDITVKAKAGKTFVPAAESKYFYTVTVSAEDSGELTGEKNHKFYVDNKKPEAAVNSVTPVVIDNTGASEIEYVNGTLKISGIASDSGNTGSGLKALSYEIKDKTSGAVQKSGNLPVSESWSFDLITKDYADNKDYDIVVKAEDVVGNVRTTSRTIKLNQSTDIPSLSLSNANDTITTAAGLGTDNNMFGSTSNNKLYGFIQDDDGLGSVAIYSRKSTSSEKTLLVPTTALTSGSKDYNFEYKLPQAQGQYEITVEIKDIYAAGTPAARQTIKDNLSKSFYITVDDGAPVFTSVSPALKDTDYFMGSKTGAAKTLVITGVVSDGNGVASLTSEHSVRKADGSYSESEESHKPVSSLTFIPGAAAVFTDTIKLADLSGTYKVVYTATDIYGQQSTFEAEYSVDVDNPVIASFAVSGSDVAEGTEIIPGWFTENSILVETVVKDTHSGIAEVSYSPDNGTTFKPMTHSVSEDSDEGEKWSAHVTFEDGEQTLVIKVKDATGNESSHNVKVNIDKTKTVLQPKWYKITDQNTEGTLLQPEGIAYVNKNVNKDLVLFGNYSDNISGVNTLTIKINETTITPKELKYYGDAFDEEATLDNVITDSEGHDKVLADKDTNAEDFEQISSQIKSFVAVINHDDFAEGSLKITGSDRTGNAGSELTRTVMKLKNDTVKPVISEIINLEKAYKKDGKYYIRNNKDKKLKISGTSTDNYGIDKTVLTITGQNSQEEKTYIIDSKNTSWEFELDFENEADLKNWIKASAPATYDAIVKIKAIDRAGNEKDASDIYLVFDESAPAVLTGKIELTAAQIAAGHTVPADYDINLVSDKDDTSNPYISDYTLRGKTAWKYGGIKIGNGNYGETSYGRESSLQLSVTFIGEKDGSGVESMEYRMRSSGTTSDSWTSEGTFAKKESTYTHYADPVPKPEYDCYVGTATIKGFEATTNGKPNLVQVRATDNCGNTGDWFELKVQMDNENPEVISDAGNPDSLLTNGHGVMQELKGTLKEGLYSSGLKAVRVYVDGILAFDCNADKYTENDSLYVENNSYGTFTVQGYAPTELQFAAADPSNEAAKYSFKNAASYAKWSLKLNPEKDNGQWADWFDDLKDKANPQVVIEAEDWAEDSSSSGNKTSLIITSLDIDVTAPVISISRPAATAGTKINGVQLIEGTVEEDHTPKSAKIYYSNAATAPASLNLKDENNKPLWTLLCEISTENGAGVQEVYSFKHNTTDFNTLIGDAESGNVHILVIAEDKAGNKNVAENAVTANQTNGKPAYTTYTVDRDSDRPVITVINATLMADEAETGTQQPLSASNYLLLKSKNINITISDDDGIINSDKDSENPQGYYRVKKQGATTESEWQPFTIKAGSASVKIDDDGKHIVEFKIKDNGGSVFTSDGIIPPATTATTLKKIYLTDKSGNKYGAKLQEGATPTGFENPIIYVNVDTKAPELKIEGIQRLDKDKAATDTEWITEDYSSKLVGGAYAKYLKVRFWASDEGSGVDDKAVSVTAKVTKEDDTSIDFTMEEEADSITPYDSEGSKKYYELTIPCIKEGEDPVEKVNYVATVTVHDKAGKTRSESITLKYDTKGPDISIKAPVQDAILSGAVAAEGGTSNNESAVFYYAISPIENSPDTYESASFSFVKVDKNEVETTVTTFPYSPVSELKELCKYQFMNNSENPEKIFANSFYLNFDGKTDGSSTGLHSDTFNMWIKNMGITNDTELSSPSFEYIYKLYFHVKAVDEAGNISEKPYPILVDPLGKRPKVTIGYPSKDGLTLGGAPDIKGTAKGANQIKNVWLQIDCTGGSKAWKGDSKWTVKDFNELVTLKDENNHLVYSFAKMSEPDTPVTEKLPESTTDAEIAEYAIKITIPGGTSWNQTINTMKELEPPENAVEDGKPVTTKQVTIWGYATDVEGFTSSSAVRTFTMDKDSPVIDQNLTLVKWATEKSGENGFIITDSSIELDSDAVAAREPYSENKNLKGQWYLIGRVSDGSGIGSFSYSLNKGTTKSANLPGKNDTQQYYKDNDVYIWRIPGDKNNYLFCMPIGNEESGKVGTSSVYIRAAEKNEGQSPKYTQDTYTIKFDNKKPEITTKLVDVDISKISATKPLEIKNNNGAYTFSGIASEDKVENVDQTGVSRIAFYFTRDITGHEKEIFDPMIRVKKSGNVISYSENSGDIASKPVCDSNDHLYWQKVTGCTVNKADIKLDKTKVPSFVHAGGLVKLNTVIYTIDSVKDDTTDSSKKVITLREEASPSNEVWFAVANVVDNDIREGDGSALRYVEDYGWGYYSDPNNAEGRPSYDDGDLVVESLIKKGTQFTWEATINSKNISDGPVILHYVVFDAAGNATDDVSVNCFVKNNPPRIAGVTLGTDENGDGVINYSTGSSESYAAYHNKYAKGYNGSTVMNEATFPLKDGDVQKSMFAIKGITEIKPEIVGGNGTVKYTYTVTNKDGTNIYSSPSKTPEILGDGTEDDENSFVDGKIVFTVKDLLKKNIADGEKQQFTFNFFDETPQESQRATLNIYLDVALRDQESAQNKIIPFYWKDKEHNSLKENSLDYGHIELPSDLAKAKDSNGAVIFKDGNPGIYTLNPKVSGAFRLEGIARDNNLLKALKIKITKSDETKILPETIATYSNGSWTTKSGTGWRVELTQATKEEYIAAGYPVPTGITPPDKIPEISQDYGHVVHWIMHIDTEQMPRMTPAAGIIISVSADDKGCPYVDETNDEVKYTPNTFANNGELKDDGTPKVAIGDIAQTTESAQTCKYTIDIVPYIRGIKTFLSTKTSKKDSSEYDRTALGHYPVANTEQIYLYGFNLAGGILYDKAYETAAETDKSKHKVDLGTAVTINTYDSYKDFTLYPIVIKTTAEGVTTETPATLENFTSGEVTVEVGGIESLNNKNFKDSQGSYGAAIPTVANYGETSTKDTFSNFYNRKPNSTNNFVLTDDVILDVWNFNDRAAKPYGAGTITDPVMKINPSNGMIGFAYQSGTRAFSMADNDNSYIGYLGGFDNFTAVSFAYDSDGNTFGTVLGGDINNSASVSKFSFMSSIWGSSGMGYYMDKQGTNHLRIEQIGQIGTKGNKNYTNYQQSLDTAGFNIDKSRILSPTIAVSGSGSSAKVYLAYYDHFNKEIRFRWAESPNTTRGFGGTHKYINDTYTKSNLGARSEKDKYYLDGFQIIAEDESYTYNNNGTGTITGSSALGNAGSYVCIDVIPANTISGITYDIVVLVWYDATSNKLMYTYSNNKLATQSEADFNGSSKTTDVWATAKTILTDAGMYCQVKADKNGGIHIAGYDKDSGDLRYAKLNSYTAAGYNESTMSCIVDSNGFVGTSITLDVAFDKAGATGKAIPYIGYYGAYGPKMAYRSSNWKNANAAVLTDGAKSDRFTGSWEVTELPTTSNAPKDRINVALWKENGVISAPTTTDSSNVVPVPSKDYTFKEGTKKYDKDPSKYANPSKPEYDPPPYEVDDTEAKTYGNGTSNPVLAYQIRPTSASGFIETAQMQ